MIRILLIIFITSMGFTPALAQEGDEVLPDLEYDYQIVIENEIDDLEYIYKEVAEKLLRCGPSALSKCKELFRKIPELPMEEANECAAEMLARLRITDEAQEGMHAFLNKRKPNWVIDED